ncbi:MAG: hypothetical protein KBA75_00880 [Alphaproteobacteria bacterium]|nr:hypothetical protein [Alphaproteobacteria bacterium]
MDIQFHTESIRQTCSSKAIAERKFGQAVALQLRNRLSDIRAAQNINEVLVGLKDKKINVLDQIRVVDLTNSYEMLLQANHRVNPKAGDGSVNWAAVDRVKVVSIEKEVSP